MRTPHPAPLATAEEIADYRRMSVQALAQERYRGEGPAYHRLGRTIRYDWAEVLKWIQDHTVTPDRGAA